VRTGPDYGNIYDHHSVTYEYANGAKLYGTCRQQAGCHNETGASAAGTEGWVELSQQPCPEKRWDDEAARLRGSEPVPLGGSACMLK